MLASVKQKERYPDSPLEEKELKILNVLALTFVANL
jgi:hypothetical protein